MIKILERVLNELKTDKPDISYIRGMVETLIDTQVEPVNAMARSSVVESSTVNRVVPGSNPGVPASKENDVLGDPARALDAIAAANLSTVRKMAGE